MAFATNTDPAPFNSGEPLDSTWSYGGSGDGFPRTMRACGLWDSQAGGQILYATPNTPPAAFTRGRTAVFPAGSISVHEPHNDQQDLWREQNAAFGGERTLLAAYRSQEAILTGGSTMGATPVQGRIFLSLHRTEFQRTNLTSVVAPGDTTLTMRAGLGNIGDYLRLAGATADLDEIVQIIAQPGPNQRQVDRGQPGYDGVPTTPGVFTIGEAVHLLDAPSIENELVPAGTVLPENPVVGQRFVFTANAGGLTNAVTTTGAVTNVAVRGWSFRYDGTQWVQEEQNSRRLSDFGAVGYSRVEVVRQPLMVAGVATAYTDAASYEANTSGWTFSAE